MDLEELRRALDMEAMRYAERQKKARERGDRYEVIRCRAYGDALRWVMSHLDAMIDD